MANECYNCGAYDSDREGCTMPSCDKSYACPLEDSSLQFFLPMIPPTVTAQEHKVSVRNGKPVFYDPPELKEARASSRRTWHSISRINRMPAEFG